MSYIAVELDALNKAPAVARAARVSEDAVIGGLARLWAYCFREQVEALTSLQVAGFFAVEVDLVPALSAFGFLEPAGDLIRVCGARRYKRVTEQRRNAGKARAASAGRSAGRLTSEPPAEHQRSTSGPPALTPSTEHRAPNTESTTAAGEAPKRPSPDSAIGWWVAAQDKREAAGLMREKPPRDLDKWFSVAMSEAQGDEQKLLKGYAAFLADSWWRNEAEKPCAWGGWVSQWRDFVTKATAPPVVNARAARAPSAIPDWTSITPGEVQL